MAPVAELLAAASYSPGLARQLAQIDQGAMFHICCALLDPGTNHEGLQLAAVEILANCWPHAPAFMLASGCVVQLLETANDQEVPSTDSLRTLSAALLRKMAGGN
eukprot:SAG31_NODE_27751_length_420_cov_2.174455_1_plen_104_part_10